MSHPSVTGFKEQLAAEPEPILILSKQYFTNLDTVIKVAGHTAKMPAAPEDPVFLT